MSVGDLWASLREILSGFSFYKIKEICAASGLPIDQLHRIRQTQGTKSASKGELIDAIDSVVHGEASSTRDRFVVACIEEVLRRTPDVREFGPWNTVWKRFWRLSRSGVFDAFFEALAGLSERAHLVQMFDSTVVRAHVSAAGAKGGNRTKPWAVHAEDSRLKFISRPI